MPQSLRVIRYHLTYHVSAIDTGSHLYLPVVLILLERSGPSYCRRAIAKVLMKFNIQETIRELRSFTVQGMFPSPFNNCSKKIYSVFLCILTALMSTIDNIYHIKTLQVIAHTYNYHGFHLCYLKMTLHDCILDDNDIGTCNESHSHQFGIAEGSD